MDSGLKFRRNADVVVRNLSEGEGGVLLHLQTGAYHGMNPVALLIWEQLDGQRTVAQVTEAVREGVDGSPDDLAADVRAFLESALERDLIAPAE